MMMVSMRPKFHLSENYMIVEAGVNRKIAAGNSQNECSPRVRSNSTADVGGIKFAEPSRDNKMPG